MSDGQAGNKALAALMGGLCTMGFGARVFGLVRLWRSKEKVPDNVDKAELAFGILTLISGSFATGLLIYRLFWDSLDPVADLIVNTFFIMFGSLEFLMGVFVREDERSTGGSTQVAPATRDASQQVANIVAPATRDASQQVANIDASPRDGVLRGSAETTASDQFASVTEHGPWPYSSSDPPSTEASSS
eukprot:TRINITY_DN2125_c0_g1_i1.p1 TRINITY_DN2125_c0_g1~~TRINITY_DN2125_c0_g1_i1.p1  ORF type:complete len:189 (+),score=4.23 TRINITY_DN2125_c0_g1_i1:260-826(+)